MFFSVGVWANQIGWQRGFQAQREIDRKLYSAFERVLKREQAGEICLPNQEAFQKHFMDELKLDKYYKNLKSLTRWALIRVEAALLSWMERQRIFPHTIINTKRIFIHFHLNPGPCQMP